jgi:uncharacterized protein (TIGR03435 family)
MAPRLTACLLLFCSVAAAQEAFEVATVKPTRPNERRVQWNTYPGGRLVLTNYTLKMLVEIAHGMSSYCVIGGPAWADTDNFSITAQAPAGSAAAAFVPPASYAASPQLLAMLRTLLADRFELKLHRERRQLPVYTLAVAKGVS